MPVQLFTPEQRLRFERFPPTIEQLDLLKCFSLSEEDKKQIPRQTGPWNRLGFALQLCTLRYLGFVPEDLRSIPEFVVDFVAHQLALTSSELSLYGARPQTRTDHLNRILDYRRFTWFHQSQRRKLKSWLFNRALEHDSAPLLLNLACDWLRREKIVRPGRSRLERLVAETRKNAEEETYGQLQPLLSAQLRKLLDRLLVMDSSLGTTQLAWLRSAATANSPKASLENLEKLTFLETAGVATWNRDALNPNRVKFLAGLARKATNQALQRAVDERRYPALISRRRQSLLEITDESIEMFDRFLSHAYARARRDLEEFRGTVAQATNEKVRLFQELARVVLDPAIGDQQGRATIFERIPATHRQKALEEAATIARPEQDHYFDFLETRYSQLRQVAPRFLELLDFQSNLANDPLLQAVAVLRTLNTEGKRALPPEISTAFAPAIWEPYLAPERSATERRHYYELSVFWALRARLRSGDIG